MNSGLSHFFQEIDALIRQGQNDKAKSLLRRWQTRKVPMEARRELANLARRLNLPTLAIRWLHPLVRPAGRTKTRTATEAEKTEYAGSLIRLGAVTEALELLKPLNAPLNPERLLLEAFAYFSQWDYRSAIPLLETYIQSPSLSDYQRLVGKTNLAAALTYEREGTASTLVSELIREADAGKWNILSVNLRMMQAETAITVGDFQLAREALGKAHESVSEDALESLFIRKWKWVTELYANPNSSLAIQGLKEVREEAKKRYHWETIRNCDYHLSIATKEIDLFYQVYFGTPFESLRARLKAHFPDLGLLPEIYQWRVKAGYPTLILDLFSPTKIKRGVKGLTPGSLPYKVLAALCQDFYRPIRVASLHGMLYENVFFNPASSPGRVHQAIKRVKQWLLKTRLPLSIEVTHGAYQLSAYEPCLISLPQQKEFTHRNDYLTLQLRNAFPSQPFTAKEAARALKINLWTAIRLLTEAVKKGLLNREGQTNQTRYTFPSAFQIKKEIA